MPKGKRRLITNDVMKQKRKIVRVYQNLAALKRIQFKLEQCKQERNHIKQQLLEEIKSHLVADRKHQIEMAKTACFADCLEALFNAFLKATEQNKEDLKADYEEVKRNTYARFLKKEEALRKIDYSAFGQHHTLFISEW